MIFNYICYIKVCLFGLFLIRDYEHFGICSFEYLNAQIDSSLVAFFGAGLIFSIINATLKPIVMILSLPMILVTLGFFTIVVNGFLVWLSLMLAPGLQMTFLNSIFAGLILSLVNYVVSSVLELSYHDEREEKS